MFYSSPSSRDLLAEFEHLQREMHRAFDSSPNIRGFARGGFPAFNVAGTPISVEVYAFVPGVDPAAIEAQLERGVLTISGERKSGLENLAQGTTTHIAERFSGRFRRIVSLPDDIDPNSVEAKYSDGVLHISIRRKAEAQPRRITIQ